MNFEKWLETGTLGNPQKQDLKPDNQQVDEWDVELDAQTEEKARSIMQNSKLDLKDKELLLGCLIGDKAPAYLMRSIESVLLQAVTYKKEQKETPRISVGNTITPASPFPFRVSFLPTGCDMNYSYGSCGIPGHCGSGGCGCPVEYNSCGGHGCGYYNYSC